MVLDTLTRGPATAGELAALLPIARPGVSRHLRVLREAGLVEVRQDAQRRVYSLRLEPLAEVDDWLGRYRVLWNSGWMPCTPRWPGETRTKEHHMTSNAAAGNRIVGTLRTEDGQGAVRMEDRSTPASTTCGRRSPIPAVWLAGLASSRATCAWAVSSGPAFLPVDGKVPGGSRCASPRGTCW